MRCWQPTTSSWSRHSRRTVPTQRSAMELALGACTGVRMISAPGRAPHVIERPGELGVPVADEERERGGLVIKDGGDVTSLLGNPPPSRMSSDARQVHPSAGELDEEQDVHSPQEDRVDGEESGRGESHPPALAEPCVNLSAHTAPITQPYGHAPSRQCANRVGSRLAMSARNRLARLR
jgi:hypothetical protein